MPNKMMKAKTKVKAPLEYGKTQHDKTNYFAVLEILDRIYLQFKDLKNIYILQC